MILGRYRTRPGIWAVSLVLAALLHVGIILGTRALRPFSPSDAHAFEPEPIQVVFAPEPAAAAQEPNFFTELPPDRAGERPEHPDFLSNVDSRAADDVPGGSAESLPAMTGESESPHVRLDPAGGGPASAERQPETPPAPAQTVERPAEEEGQESEQEGRTEPVPSSVTGTERRIVSDMNALSRQSQRRLKEPLRDYFRESQASSESAPSPLTEGASDRYQDSMSNPLGNALSSGGISLNTIAWDYAPWLQRFIRDVEERWRAPYAYYLGVISGWTLVEIEVAPSGELLRIEALDEQGHASLKNASLAALRAAAPYRPLPSDFPEDSLILRIKLIYPEHKR
jgi:outer membrane biosynthesis protein TonB